MNATPENVRLLLRELERRQTDSERDARLLSVGSGQGHLLASAVAAGQAQGYEAAIDAVRAYLEVTDD